MAPTTLPTATGTIPISPDQSSDGLSNRVALTALILGGGAFIIAFLQLTYEYFISRAKCSRGAIGVWSKHTKLLWDMHNWVPRVMYPEVEFDIMMVLNAREIEDNRVKKLFGFQTEDEFKWVNMAGGDDKTLFFDVRHGGWKLVYAKNATDAKEAETAKAVKIWQLPISKWHIWLINLWQYPREQWIRPARASWANMLECLDVYSKDVCAIGKYHPTDVIPSGLDAPFQTTKLINIALWGYVLGMKELQLDTKNETIMARNRYASIATTPQTVPGISKIVHIEGDLDALEGMIDQASTNELREVVRTVQGWLGFTSTIRSHMTAFEPYKVIMDLRQRPPDQTRCSDSEVPWVAYNMIWQAEKFDIAEKNRKKECHKDEIEESPKDKKRSEAKELSKECRTTAVFSEDTCEPKIWTAFWDSIHLHSRHRAVGKCPTLLQTFSFLPYQSICSGFPWNALRPYHAFLTKQCASWWEKEGPTMCYENHDLYLALRNQTEEENCTFPFIRPKRTFLIIDREGRGEEGSGLYSWIFETYNSYQGKLKEKQRTSFEEKISYKKSLGHPDFRLSILEKVGRILKGELTIDEARDEVQSKMTVSKKDYVTVETAVWFTLFTLEGHIEALWKNVMNGTQAKDPDEGTIGHNVAFFLFIWLRMCVHVDPFSDEKEKIEEAFEKALQKKFADGDDEYCRLFRSAVGEDGYGHDELCEWATEKERMVWMKELLRWLKLRGFLMYFYSWCKQDSSQVAAGLYNEPLIRVA
jgi:hypothetical protein